MESHGSKINTLDYDMTLNFREGKYHLCIPDLIISAKGSDLASTYQNLILKRDGFFKEAEIAGINILPGRTRNLSKQYPNQKTLKNFLKKLLVSLSIILFCLFALIETTAYFIDKSLNSINSRISSYVGDGTKQSRARVLAVRIQNFFLDNKRQEKILKNTRILVKRFRPFIKELSLVFSENMGH